MRITLTLEDELLDALRARSQHEGRPVEAVAAELVRRGLAEGSRPTYGDVRNDFQLLPVRPDEPPVTNELIWRLMDEAE